METIDLKGIMGNFASTYPTGFRPITWRIIPGLVSGYSSPCISAVRKGNILGGQQLTMVINHLHPLGAHPPSTAVDIPKKNMLEPANDADSIGRISLPPGMLNKASGGFSSYSVFVFGAGSIRIQQRITQQTSEIPKVCRMFAIPRLGGHHFCLTSIPETWTYHLKFTKNLFEIHHTFYILLFLPNHGSVENGMPPRLVFFTSRLLFFHWAMILGEKVPSLKQTNRPWK